MLEERNSVPYNDFQKEMRQWYAEKKREFASAKSDDDVFNYNSFLQDRYETIERKLAIERNRLRQQFAQKCFVNKQRTEYSNKMLDSKRAELLAEDQVKRYLKGYHRFEPTPELRPEFVLFGVVPVEDFQVLDDFPDLQDENIENANSNKNFYSEEKPFQDSRSIDSDAQKQSFSTTKLTSGLASGNSSLNITKTNPLFASSMLTSAVVTTAGDFPVKSTASISMQPPTTLVTTTKASSSLFNTGKNDVAAVTFSSTGNSFSTPKTTKTVAQKTIAMTTTATNDSYLAASASLQKNLFTSPTPTCVEPKFSFLQTSTPLSSDSSRFNFTFRPSDVGLNASASGTDSATPINFNNGALQQAISEKSSGNDSHYFSAREYSERINSKDDFNNEVLRQPRNDTNNALQQANNNSSYDKTVGASLYENLTDDESFELLDEILDENFLDGCALARWIQYFTRLNTELSATIDAYEKDTARKKARFTLKRAILDKINFSAKKKASNADLAQTLSFFISLFNGQHVVDSDGGDLFLDSNANSDALYYAMQTMAQKYIEQIKWDMELMDTIVLLLASICSKSQCFYKIFCAVILNSSVFLKMSLSKVLDKALSFAYQPAEAAALWISSERAVFHLFFRVQLALKPPVSNAPQSLRGPPLLYLFLRDVLSLEKPVFCASAFIVSELIENCLKPLLRAAINTNEAITVKPNQLMSEWAMSATARICEYDWIAVLAVIEHQLADEEAVVSVLRSRHDALLCCLRHSIEHKLCASSLKTSPL